MSASMGDRSLTSTSTQGQLSCLIVERRQTKSTPSKQQIQQKNNDNSFRSTSPGQRSSNGVWCQLSRVSVLLFLLTLMISAGPHSADAKCQCVVQRSRYCCEIYKGICCEFPRKSRELDEKMTTLELLFWKMLVHDSPDVSEHIWYENLNGLHPPPPSAAADDGTTDDTNSDTNSIVVSSTGEHLSELQTADGQSDLQSSADSSLSSSSVDVPDDDSDVVAMTNNVIPSSSSSSAINMDSFSTEDTDDSSLQYRRGMGSSLIR